ncbi:esterase/lipase family protein [Nitratidesulfovibrio liaohensis]|uniref:esterase/lipase family protein n=1 Tax=Nitratidesulfovibrio liaohensis TaxID=2604158 RepID=UPI001420A8D2|nr:hypothetical protein [Nitratidesulfovibrio liaohensis]NHZ47844.1 hypothetical protein [Nitratidesulfovibrio liaohensis]
MCKDVQYPIIYVRGYAMTKSEVNETTADPFCGFNIGSTVYRAATDRSKKARKFIFESPVVRLMTDFGYKDVFEDGMDIMDEGWSGAFPQRSIVVYRYYEQASDLLGQGETPDISVFAKGLSDLILRVKDLVCANPANNMSADKFSCYLVAHSMGGLVCRAFLQNPAFGSDTARACVDKVFTYATPHNGIDMGGLNVPDWLTMFGMDTFSRENMAKYLNVEQYAAVDPNGRVDWLPDLGGAGWKFSVDRFFCMIGTNRGDYDVAMGLSRTFSGHGGDGLVKIENASVWRPADGGNEAVPSPRAYAYRSHSGYFGIVNSEESYQNLIRFLFGDVRIDVWANVDDVRLPVKVAQAAGNKPVNANYLFETSIAPRGKLWSLTRRKAEEDSAACRNYVALAGSDSTAKSIYLSSVFLGMQWRVNPNSTSLAYSLSLCVRVPEYEIDNRLWLDDHYEGGALFQDTLVVEAFLNLADKGVTHVDYAWRSTGQSGQYVVPQDQPNDVLVLAVPFGNNNTPGINGVLRCFISEWNV